MNGIGAPPEIGDKQNGRYVEALLTTRQGATKVTVFYFFGKILEEGLQNPGVAGNGEAFGVGVQVQFHLELLGGRLTESRHRGQCG